MRNRGLEICPLGSWTSSLDVRSLLLQSGLYSPKLQNALVIAHRAATDALPGMLIHFFHLIPLYMHGKVFWGSGRCA